MTTFLSRLLFLLGILAGLLTSAFATSASLGQTVTFSVTAGGTAPFTYQWYKDGVAISGATSASYTINSMAATHAGAYTVTVTNQAGSATSASNALTLATIGAPSITTQPASRTIDAGTSTTFTVAATGAALTYQWVYNDLDIVGATSSSYTVTAAQPGDSGNYVVVVRNIYGVDISAAAVLTVNGTSTGGNVVVPDDNSGGDEYVVDGGTPADPGAPGTRLSNLSVRSVAGRGGNPLIVGLTMTGASSKPVLLRAAGPALAAFGVGGTLADPNLKVYDNGSEVGSNDNWGANSTTISTVGSRVGAFPLVDTSSKDTALVSTLSGSRTVHVNSSRSGESGVVLVEAYDAGSGADTRMTNASARNWCGTGSDVLVLGFAIDGPSTRKVLVRAVGPGLTVFGVTGALADPKIELHKLGSGDPTLLATNDNWGGAANISAAFAQAGAFALDSSSKDAALIATLPAGAYTLTVSGVNNVTGEALVEIYELE